MQHHWTNWTTGSSGRKLIIITSTIAFSLRCLKPRTEPTDSWYNLHRGTSQTHWTTALQNLELNQRPLHTSTEVYLYRTNCSTTTHSPNLVFSINTTVWVLWYVPILFSLLVPILFCSCWYPVLRRIKLLGLINRFVSPGVGSRAKVGERRC